jgi:hypothetical protein
MHDRQESRPCEACLTPPRHRARAHASPNREARLAIEVRVLTISGAGAFTSRLGDTPLGRAATVVDAAAGKSLS